MSTMEKTPQQLAEEYQTSKPMQQKAIRGWAHGAYAAPQHIRYVQENFTGVRNRATTKQDRAHARN